MPETIRGTERADDLTAGGDDTVLAGAGDDTLRLRDFVQGEGVFDGGAGTDILILGDASAFDARAVDEDDPLAGIVLEIDWYQTNGRSDLELTVIGIEDVVLSDPFDDALFLDLAIRVGTTGDDEIEGETFARSFLHGGSGDDVLQGMYVDGFRYASDTLVGGSGDDTLVGFGAADVDGGTGADEIYANGSGTIDAGAGDDLIELSRGETFSLSGGAGADTLRLSGGERVDLTADDVREYDGDLIDGFARGHRLTFGGDTDTATLSHARTGDETVFSVDLGQDGTVEASFTMTGLDDPAAIVLVNDSGLAGLPAWSLRDGTPELLEGSEQDDELFGFGGNDTLRGGEGEDRLDGREGDDLIEGGGGNDRIARGYGDDTLYAGDGDDDIRIGLGDDVVFGEGGDDRLTLFTPGANSFSEADGGEGTDTLGLGVIAGWDTTLTVEDGGLTVTTDYVLFGNEQGGVRLTDFERLDLLGVFANRDADAPAVLVLEGDLSGYLDEATIDAGLVNRVRFDASSAVGGVGFAVTGGDGADSLSGGDGSDDLSGSEGADLLIGGGGADLLAGGAGDDVLYGDGGAG